MDKNDEVEKFFTATKKQGNEQQSKLDNKPKEEVKKPHYIDQTPHQSEPLQTNIKTSVPTKSKSSFDPMWIAVAVLSLGLFYSLYLASQNKPAVVLEKHKTTVYKWFMDWLKTEEVEKHIVDTANKNIPDSVREFYNYKLKQGEAIRLKVIRKRLKNGKVLETFTFVPSQVELSTPR